MSLNFIGTIFLITSVRCSWNVTSMCSMNPPFVKPWLLCLFVNGVDLQAGWLHTIYIQTAVQRLTNVEQFTTAQFAICLDLHLGVLLVDLIGSRSEAPPPQPSGVLVLGPFGRNSAASQCQSLPVWSYLCGAIRRFSICDCLCWARVHLGGSSCTALPPSTSIKPMGQLSKNPKPLGDPPVPASFLLGSFTEKVPIGM